MTTLKDIIRELQKYADLILQMRKYWWFLSFPFFIGFAVIKLEWWVAALVSYALIATMAILIGIIYYWKNHIQERRYGVFDPNIRINKEDIEFEIIERNKFRYKVVFIATPRVDRLREHYFRFLWTGDKKSIRLTDSSNNVAVSLASGARGYTHVISEFKEDKARGANLDWHFEFQLSDNPKDRFDGRYGLRAYGKIFDIICVKLIFPEEFAGQTIFYSKKLESFDAPSLETESHVLSLDGATRKCIFTLSAHPGGRLVHLVDFREAFGMIYYGE